MGLYTLSCPNCGAPLPKHARWTAVKCAHCGAVAAPGMQVVSRKTFRDALLRSERKLPVSPADVDVSGVRYRVLGAIARGDRADVLLATRARPPTERAIVKVLRDGGDTSLDPEWDALEALHASTAQGAPHFTLRLPPLVARGHARFAAGGGGGPALVFRALPGFDASLASLRDEFPHGIDPRHLVWIWRRLLELLAWVHRSGWTHGAVDPSHVVLEPREHGAILVGWSRATRLSASATAAADLTMAADAVLAALGDSPAEALPVEQLLRACAQGDLPSTDGWQLKEIVADAAKRAFGPPTFVPLVLPPRRLHPAP